VENGIDWNKAPLTLLLVYMPSLFLFVEDLGNIQIYYILWTLKESVDY